MINNYLNKELKKFIVTPENTIKSALKKITNCGQRCVAVVSKKITFLVHLLIVILEKHYY